VPRLGSIRLHGNVRQLARRISRGSAVVQSVTISRRGHRWYASILAAETIAAPVTTRRQKTAGIVGVDLGVHHLAALSDGTLIPNPRHLTRARTRLLKAARAYARTQPESANRADSAARLARLHHQIAEARTGHLHQVTKHLATGWATVAIEDLNVAGMTAAPKPRPDPTTSGAWVRNGKRAKAGLNRAVLDVSPGEIRRQLTYKTTWYGSSLHLVDRWYPSSQICSACGSRNPKLSLRERVYTCPCGHQADRDTNAAIVLAQHAAAAPQVARDVQETVNARRAGRRPPRPDTSSDAGRPPRSPQPSNGPGVHAHSAA
jgi:putative transposase